MSGYRKGTGPADLPFSPHLNLSIYSSCPICCSTLNHLFISHRVHRRLHHIKLSRKKCSMYSWCFVSFFISVHGGWSSWAGWEACSVSCDEGVKKRHRTCTSPAPTVFGHYCIGDSVDFDICHEQPCNNITTGK